MFPCSPKPLGDPLYCVVSFSVFLQCLFVCLLLFFKVIRYPFHSVVERKSKIKVKQLAYLQLVSDVSVRGAMRERPGYSCRLEDKNNLKKN